MSKITEAATCPDCGKMSDDYLNHAVCPNCEAFLDAEAAAFPVRPVLRLVKG